jgi:hypothetical protein
MKKIIFVCITFCFTVVLLNAQDTTITKKNIFEQFDKGGYASLIFNQISFLNWAKGGENTVSATGIVSLFAKLKKERFAWENTVDLRYGLQNSEEFGLRTNQDVIDLSSKVGFKALHSFFYTALINFKTQFANGYNYPNDSVVISKFLSPAYLITSLGVDYKPNDEFSLYFSPMTGKFIFVSNQDIADIGTYTGEPAAKDSTGKIIKSGRTSKSDFGAYLRVNLKKQLMENITLNAKFDIFNNYTDKNILNRKNFDIDSEASVLMKVNEIISVNILLHLIYDHDTKVPLYEYRNSKKTQIGAGPRLQVKEVIGIGISYYFK